MISLKIIDRNNKSTDITQIVEKVTWSGDYKQASRKLEFSIISNKYDTKIPQVTVEEGYMVYFYEDEKELFRGFIYTVEKTTNTTSFLAYDHAQKLVNIKVNYNFKDMTAKQITEKMLDDYSKYGIQKGEIIDDGVTWSKVFIGVSMYETIMSAYTNSYAENDKEYMCYAKEGKIYTSLKGNIKLRVQFNEKENITSTTYKSSIENLVNKVIIVDDTGNQIDEVKDENSIELYGLFQEIIKAESQQTEIQTTTPDIPSDPDNPDNPDNPEDETPQVSTGKFIWPVPSVHSISSPFGRRKAPTKGASTYHKGIDIPGGGVSGKSIIASDSGKVVVASTGHNLGRGNYVVIDHGNGKGTLYQHLKSYSVKVGQSVKQGNEIAKMGNTGVGTGPHLHFEVHENFSGTKGIPVNPLKYVSPNGSSKASSTSTSAFASTSTSTSYTLNTTNTVAKAIFSYCISKGFSPASAAAIVGNAECESTFDTSDINKSSGATGLLQWRLERLSSLKSKANKRGVSWTNLQLQLDHMMDELHGEDALTKKLLDRNVGGLEGFKKLTDPYKAGYQFGVCFERGGGNSTRGETSQKWYKKVVSGGKEITTTNPNPDDTTDTDNTTDQIENNNTTTTVIDIETAKKEAKIMLKEKERERTASLDGYGDTTCITGNGVTVTDSSTGLTGLFYIDTDSHTWEGGDYKIQLSLNYKNLMNTFTSGEDEQQQTTIGGDYNYDDNSNDDNSNTGELNGKKVKAIFTAYWPGPGIEGGIYQSMGGLLDTSKQTCAAPKEIPFKTKIQPLGTGTSIDGKLYTVTDRGGKIVVKNGVYHIDILKKNAKECNEFGVRHGYMIIGDGTGYKKGSGNTPSKNLPLNEKQKKLVAVAKTKLGCRYVWGAPSGSETIFDCSSFTQWVYKKALGINLQRTSNIQGEQGKKITSTSQLQVGDLVYFNTKSTDRANRITHVTMYIGNGQIIHASYSRGKIVIVDLKSYMNSSSKIHFIWARRHI